MGQGGNEGVERERMKRTYLCFGKKKREGRAHNRTQKEEARITSLPAFYNRFQKTKRERERRECVCEESGRECRAKRDSSQ